MTAPFRWERRAHPDPGYMVCLRTVPDVFRARVLAARLGADGIVTEMRGGFGGPYPIGCVSIWVRREDASVASELLLADEVESAFDLDEEWDRQVRRPIIFGWTARRLLAALALLIIVATLLAGRLAGT